QRHRAHDDLGSPDRPRRADALGVDAWAWCLGVAAGRRGASTTATASAPASASASASPEPPNNDFVNAVTLSGSGTIGGTTVNADGETGEPVQPDQGQINSVWYRFTPTAAGSAHFDTCTDVLYDGAMASYTSPVA